MASRYLYLVRHGEAIDEGELSEAGGRQATALGERLRDVRFAGIHHGPLPRATQTARVIAARLPGVPVYVSDVVGDYLPPVPDPAGLAASVARLVDSYAPAERAEGAALAAAAIERFAVVPASLADDENELIVTHSFLVAWFVRHALGAPDDRWLGLNAANAALTVIRCPSDQPPRLLVFNEMSHLPPELRWTGFPPELHV